MMRYAVVVLTFGAAFAQSPRFDAASIHPSLTPSEFTRQHGQPPHLILTPTRVDLQVASLSALIERAYQLDSFQLSGPDWMSATRFDIQAKPPEAATQQQVQEMLQNLLAERFGLVAHHEQHERNVYALVAGKDGSKFKESSTGADIAAPSPGRLLMLRLWDEDGKIAAGTWLEGGKTVFEAAHMNMPQFASFLKNYLDDPVLDRTGLTGVYQFTLEVPANTNRARINPASADQATDPGPSILSTIQSLGLRLERRKERMDFLVVDHLEKTPTDN